MRLAAAALRWRKAARRSACAVEHFLKAFTGINESVRITTQTLSRRATGRVVDST
jgi:hypothetical protein